MTPSTRDLLKPKSLSTILIFSYGSNMCNNELSKYSKKIITPDNRTHFTVLDVGYLPKHTFVYYPLYVKTNNPTLKTAKATIIKETSANKSTSNANAKVYGTITEVSPELYQLILTKEGIYKNYYKPVVKVITSLASKEKYKAITFVMTNKYKNKLPISSISPYPSELYESMIVKAAVHYQFPKKYINTYLKTLK